MPRDTSPSAASWSAVADYPTKIMDNAAVAVNGRIYSFTGLNGTDLTTKNYVYDQGAQSWSPIADLTQARENPFAVAIGTKVYLAGGWVSPGRPTATWRSTTPPPTRGPPAPRCPRRTRPWAARSSGGKVYVIGGCLQDSCGVKDVQVYDPATDTWSAGPSLPMALSWTSCGTSPARCTAPAARAAWTTSAPASR